MNQLSTQLHCRTQLNPSDLFRREALAALTCRQEGEVSAACGPSIAISSFLAIAIVLALVLFACNASYSRTVNVQGFIEPAAGLVKLRAPASGIVDQLYIREGDIVRKGDALLALSFDTISADYAFSGTTLIDKLQQQGQELNKEIRTLGKIEKLQPGAQRDTQRLLGDELALLEREITVQLERVSTAERSLRRMEQLASEQLVSAVEVDEKTQRLLEQRAVLESLRRQALRSKREQQTLHDTSQSDLLRARNDRSRAERELSTLEQRIAELEIDRGILITATSDGTVRGLLVGEGQTVRAQSSLLTIVPSGSSLEARLLLPSHAAGLVQSEQSVRIRYPAFPHERYGTYSGRITHVSSTLLFPGERELPIALGEPAYIARVSLAEQGVEAAGFLTPLKIGMRLEADVALDRRGLIDWFLAPLLDVGTRWQSAQGAMSSAPSTATGS